jgi:hypothetical protein
MKILSKVDMTKKEIENFVVDKNTSAPSNPVEGQIYHNTQNKETYIYRNSQWEPFTTIKVDGGTFA